MLAKIRWNSGLGWPHGGRYHGSAILFRTLNLSFNIANGRKIFVRLAVIGATERGRKAFRIAHREIENAVTILLLPGRARRIGIEIAGSEQSFEQCPGPHLRGIGRRRCPPRNTVAVSAAIAVIATTALHTLLASKFERSEPRFAFKLLRCNRAYRTARFYISPIALLAPNPLQYPDA